MNAVDRALSQPFSNPNTACDCRLDLLMSCFVTEERWDSAEWKPGHEVYEVHHRYSRFDVLVYTLRSYAALPLERVYLYIELDKSFSSRRNELRTLTRSLFGARLITYQERRLTTQREWRHELSHTISITNGAVGSEQGDSRLVWFMQNDDHPFIDVNTDVLCEGLARMRADKSSRFKSLYPSHWASALSLAGKVQQPEVHGSYLVSRLTMLDSVQILNYRYLHHILLGLDWKGSYRRVDMLIRQRQIYDTKEIGPKAKLAKLFATDRSLQSFYVPLRELCRKFDAYMEMTIDVRVTRPLILPPQANMETGALTTNPAAIRAMLRRPGRTLWSIENSFSLPSAWIERSVRLYANANARHAARTRLCGNSSTYQPLINVFDQAVSNTSGALGSKARGLLCSTSGTGRRSCGERVAEIMRRQPKLTTKQARLKVGSDPRWREICEACGPCAGRCDVPVVHVRGIGVGTEPMESLLSVPRG